MATKYDLAGRVGIVTGASAGLGIEFAHALAGAGAHVVLAARREDRLHDLARDLESAYGVRALPVRTDIANEEEIIALVETAVRELGTVDILVNNAGITGGTPLREHSTELFRQIMEVNVTSMFIACREAAKVMIPKRSGSIINIGSIFSSRTVKQFGIPAYYASKGAVTSLTQSLAVELGPDNVRVNAIAPGFFPTEMSVEMFSPGEESANLRAEVLARRTALPFFGESEYVRGAVCFLASDDAKFITGHTLVVDGGWMAI
jgi:NAD(P)-dependent dehydrogenase (short-subunit alcohol dehydrogenase family)